LVAKERLHDVDVRLDETWDHSRASGVEGEGVTADGLGPPADGCDPPVAD
jgi:hypothetical protein